MMGKDMLYIFLYVLPGSVTGAGVLFTQCVIKPRITSKQVGASVCCSGWHVVADTGTDTGDSEA